MPLANVNSPRGFTLYQPGGKREVKRIERHVLASRGSDLMVGDAYTLDSGNNASKATAGDPVYGIVEGIQVAPIAASPQGPVSQDYIPAADSGDIIGIEDPDAVFNVQVTTIDITTQGNAKANLLDAPGSEALRRSRQEIDGGTLGAGTQFQVLGLVPSPADNASGAFAQIMVRMLQTL